jgi:hypothetical protein
LRFLFRFLSFSHFFSLSSPSFSFLCM